MSQYLTEGEIATYCTSQAGVEVADVVIASALIDGFVGYSFSVNEKTETVKIKENHRGKLNYAPVISIENVTEKVMTSIGFTNSTIDKDNISLDSEMDGYFTLFAQPSPFGIGCSYMHHHKPMERHLTIKYKYGYSSVPEDIKVVCAMLAQNIRQFNTFAGFKSLKTLDYTVEMGNPSFFTDDMRSILLKYRSLR